MKKNIALSAVALAMLAGFSLNANAIDSNITFNGVVTATTCTLNASDAAKVLTLPTVSPATLVSYGTVATATTNSTFNFTNCPSTLTKITSTYTAVGTVVRGISGANGAVVPSAGTAQNIRVSVAQTGVAWLPVDGSTSSGNSTTIPAPVSPATTSSVAVPVQVAVNASSAFDSTQPAPTAGTYTAVFNVSFSYS